MVLAPGQVAEANLTGQSVESSTPSDGRLRGPDFTARVTEVSWPQAVLGSSGVDYVAGAGRRLVAFSLAVTQPSEDAGLGNAPTGVSAVLKVGAASMAVPMTSINQQISAGTSATSDTTGTDSFVASVPARTHSISLTLSEQGFSQSFDLWTLERSAPSPVVLYRDPTSSTVTGTAGSSFHLTFTNPADGFSSDDDAQVTSATLGYFGPGSAATTPGSPNEACLTLQIQSSYPSLSYGQPDWGHYFASFTPLAGNQLTFTPTGGTAVTAIADTTDFPSTDAAADDDGIFDALYTFVVPATTTSGTLVVSAGTASGVEFTGFVGSGSNEPIDVAASATTTISFPVVPTSPPAQKKPPWVGAPLPATGLGAAPSASSNATAPSKGFPIWLAVLVVALLAVGVVVVQRRFRHRPAPVPGDAAPVFVERSAEVVAAMPEEAAVVTAPAPLDQTDQSSGELAVNVLGPLVIVGLPTRSDRRIVLELFVYLVCHDHRHLTSGQIRIGLWPVGSERDEVEAKTLRNRLSELRSWVGVEHLPEASAREGYRIEGVGSDWADFQRLAREADVTGGDAANALRTEALALVRGHPFEDVVDTFAWVANEGLADHMAVAIANCAERLATDHFEAHRYAESEAAARAGVLGAPDEFSLWRIGALAIKAGRDRSAPQTVADRGRSAPRGRGRGAHRSGLDGPHESDQS